MWSLQVPGYRRRNLARALLAWAMRPCKGASPNGCGGGPPIQEFPRCFLRSASCSTCRARSATSTRPRGARCRWPRSEAARKAVARKGRPWLIDAEFQSAQYERTRRAAARLINAEPRRRRAHLLGRLRRGDRGQGAGACPAGSRVLVLEDDHSSPVLEWMTRAEAEGFPVETVRRPGNGDWTEAVLEAIERTGAAPDRASPRSRRCTGRTAARSTSPASPRRCARAAPRSSSMPRTAPACMPLDVGALDPDFVVFPTYKWLLGPYGRAFLYVAKRHQGGIPLEQTSHGRRSVRAEQDIYFKDTRTSAMRGASTWASAITSSPWRWRRWAWRWSPTGATPLSSRSGSRCSRGGSPTGSTPRA